MARERETVFINVRMGMLRRHGDRNDTHDPGIQNEQNQIARRAKCETQHHNVQIHSQLASCKTLRQNIRRSASTRNVGGVL